MGHLSALLLSTSTRPRIDSRLVGAPEIEKATAVLEELFGDGANGKPPGDRDLVALWRRLDAAERQSDLQSISNRDWREAPWCFWMSPDGAKPFLQRSILMTHYGQWLEQRSRQSDYRKLIQAWLMNFDRDAPIQYVTKLIINGCERWPDWLWTKRHGMHALFSIADGPTVLGRRVVEEPAPISEVHRDHGMGEWIQTGGYAAAAFEAGLADITRRLRTCVIEDRTRQLVQRCIEWSESPGGDLRFPESRAILADALLLPWKSDPVPKESEASITAFLLRTLGDPRIHRSRWTGVNEDAVNVFKRWLTGATLEAFVRIIEQVADQAQFRYRKAFWMAYYKAGHILDAWIAMGPEGEQIAARLKDVKGQFGKLTGQRQLNHCVLILKIGSLVVADWSHQGKCRIWRQGSRLAPALYHPAYDAHELRDSPDYETAHHGSQAGSWQDEIHRHILENTSIRLQSRDLMP